MRRVRIILGLYILLLFSAQAVEDTGLFDGSDVEVSTVTNAPPATEEVKDPKTGWDKEGKAPPEDPAEEKPLAEEESVAEDESDLPETVEREAPVLNLPPVVDHGTNTVEEVEELPEAEVPAGEQVENPSSTPFEPSEQVTAGAAVAFPVDI